jgi:hypothetical protein
MRVEKNDERNSSFLSPPCKSYYFLKTHFIGILQLIYAILFSKQFAFVNEMTIKV